MATKLVSPESRLLARPSSPPSNTSPESRQRLFSNSVNESGQSTVLQDILSRFQGFRGATIRVLDWYRRAWKDMSEELRLLVDTDTKAPTKPISTSESPPDYTIKGTSFEGLFSSMKRSVTSAESMIHNYCFKRRGKYSEAECKQGVGIALERMANDIWKQVYGYVQKPVGTRASEALKALSRQQEDTEAIAAKLKEAQVHFEEVLKRHLNFSGMGESPAQPISPEDEAIFKDDRSSELSDQARASPFPKELTAELSEQSNRLLKSFQKFASSGIREPGPLPARREMDSILRDMLLMVKTSKAEVGRVKEELGSQKFERQLNRMRYRVESLCKSMEEATSKRVTFAAAQVGPSPLQEEISRLRDVVFRQSVVIDRYRAEERLPIHVSDVPQSPVPEAASFHMPEMDQLTQAQQTIMTDIREMKQHMDRFFYSSKDSAPDSSKSQTLKVLKAAAPHIRASNDSEFLQLFIDDLVALRKSQQSLLSTLNNEGYSLETLEDVSKEFLKVRGDYLSLKEEHDETLLKIIRVQSEAEIEGSYLESRIKFLEAELEESKKAEQYTPESSSPRSHRRVSDYQFGSVEEENALLSTENFELLIKLEVVSREKTAILAQCADLQRELETSNRKAEELQGSLQAQEALFQSHIPMSERSRDLQEEDPLLEDRDEGRKVSEDQGMLETPSIEDLMPGEDDTRDRVVKSIDGLVLTDDPQETEAIPALKFPSLPQSSTNEQDPPTTSRSPPPGKAEGEEPSEPISRQDENAPPSPPAH